MYWLQSVIMNRVLWDTIFLITGSLFTFGAGQGHSTIASSSLITPNATHAPNVSTSASPMPATTTTTIIITINSTTNSTGNTTGNTTITSTNTTITSTIKIPPVKKLVAVRSHFDDCPDSHSHFCFHGTCRFLILEETPACICHSGFIGMRCEHADLLAVVATNHRPQTVATALVLCVICCVMTMLFCTLLHCWWRRDCHRRSRALHYVSEKPSSMSTGGVSFCRPESVV